jgi:hypothetical protein
MAHVRCNVQLHMPGTRHLQCVHIRRHPSTVHGGSLLHGSSQHARCTSDLHDESPNAWCSTHKYDIAHCTEDNLEMHGPNSPAMFCAQCTANTGRAITAYQILTAWMIKTSTDTRKKYSISTIPTSG